MHSVRRVERRATADCLWVVALWHGGAQRVRGLLSLLSQSLCCGSGGRQQSGRCCECWQELSSAAWHPVRTDSLVATSFFRIRIVSSPKIGLTRLCIHPWQVMKWSDGSYLEDQDMWWLSGIHRCWI